MQAFPETARKVQNIDHEGCVYVNIRVGYSNHLGNTTTAHQIFKRNRASAAFNGCENEEYIEDENTIILLA